MTWHRTTATSPTRLPAYGLLLGSVFLVLMLSPLLTKSPAGIHAGRVLGGAILLAALLAAGVRGRALALLVPALILVVVAGNSGVTALVAPSVLARLAVLIYVEARIVRQVLHEEEVGWDTVAGAAAGYVVLGVIWGDIYILLEHAQPGSFDVPASFAVGPDGDLRAAFVYFSFVTLTTVGYGVIHPHDVGSGGVCVAEAVVGQLYLAIMISRMVSLHLARRMPDPAHEHRGEKAS